MTKMSESALVELIQGASHGTLTDAEHAQLTSALLENSEARKLCRSYFLLDAHLYWNCLREAAVFSDDSRSSASSISLGSVLATDTSIEEPSDLQGFNKPAAYVLMGNRSEKRQRGRRWFNRRLLGWAASLLLVGYFGTIVWLLIWDGFRVLDEQTQVVRHRMNASAAQLKFGDDVSWKTDITADGREYRVLEVRSGLAGLNFARGAEVVIAGPAEFEVRSPNGGFLRLGKLAAHVPPEAVGFEVATMTARVVDLGTDFRLSVDDEKTQFAVTAGKTDLYALNGNRQNNEQSISSLRRIVGGQAVAITTAADGATVVEETKFDPNWLAEIAPASSFDWSTSPVVAYQSLDGLAGNEAKFHGGVGLDFEVAAPIRVYRLGVFDHLGDGIDPSSSITVQLWSRDTRSTPQTSDDDGGQIIASEIFTSESAGQLKYGHRFKELPEPIDLPVGSYSVVVYGLAQANSFVAFEGLEHGFNFNVDPGWMGANNTRWNNNFGWVSSIDKGGRKNGEVGGRFVRSSHESTYGDTMLTRSFTLNDSIFASGSFRFANSANMDGVVFVGHYSRATSDNKREFVGMELKEDGGGVVMARARMYRMGSDFRAGAMSSWIGLGAERTYHFEYTYDPTFEADGTHFGSEGNVTLHVYSDGLLFDHTAVAVLEGEHRDSDATFDAFGMGIPAGATSGDDPGKGVDLFIDNVSYSGLRGSVHGISNALRPQVSEAQGRVETAFGAITPAGSRIENCEPGTFPKMVGEKVVGYVAGSFEYSTKKVSSEQQ